MKIKLRAVLSLLIFLFIFTIISVRVFAEDKSSPGRIIPKLQKTPNDPELLNGHVYPEWGPVCQRYTYSVVYRDKNGRKPEYVKIYFNGKMIDMQKADSNNTDYQNGVKYIYQFVPNKLGSNFYYFEASNGLGKARASIIDSPDNGPVLFESAFDKNEIALINNKTAQKMWSYSTGKEWIGGVALSDNGKFLAVLTSRHVYFFSTSKGEPLWQYEFSEGSPIGGGPRGNGIAISADASKIIAAAGMKIILFNSKSNQPIWQYNSPALAVTISKNGQYAAASSGKQAKEGMLNVLFIWKTDNSQPIWEFTNNSNFHDLALSADGQYLAASTGCPDRKAYIFSRESRKPLVESAKLTFDSPVSKSKISDDGSLAAFATEGGPDSSIVVFFSKNSQTPIWKFSNQKRNSTRAMSMTSDGQFIAAATMMGDVYLLSKAGNVPLRTWSLNTSVGGLDIDDGGRLVVLGGTDKKVHLLDSQSGKEKTVSMSEFIQSIDVSADGQYSAVGTGGSVYFFEDYLTPNKNKIFTCDKIIEPEPQKTVMTFNNQFPQRPSLTEEKTKENLSVLLLAGAAVVVFLFLLCYLFVVHFKRRTAINRKVIVLGLILALLFLAGALVISILKDKEIEKSQNSIQKKEIHQLPASDKGACGDGLCEPMKGEDGESCPQDCQDKKNPYLKNPGVCGNDLCEPNLGESKESCPKDCSGGD